MSDAFPDSPPDSMVPDEASLQQKLISCVSTISTREQANAMAEQLVRERLAACAQVEGPIQSHYAWQGEQHCDEEFRIIIKSVYGVWTRLNDRLAELHPYDEPQIIMTLIDDASVGYRNWVVEQVDG